MSDWHEAGPECANSKSMDDCPAWTETFGVFEQCQVCRRIRPVQILRELNERLAKIEGSDA